MTQNQIRQAIYDAFCRTIEIGKPPTLAVFLTKTLKQTWPKNQPIPRDRPGLLVAGHRDGDSKRLPQKG